MATITEAASVELHEHLALLMMWAGREGYPMADSLGYFDKLDLSSGEKLHHDCSVIWPGYGEVIRNRKWCIWSLIERILNTADAPEQVVIAGSGFGPLSVEMHTRWPQLNIYDIENIGLTDKHDICMGLGVCDPQSVHFVPADITDTAELASRMAVAGWDSAASSLVIIEGLSYYLTSEQLAELSAMFTAGSVFVADYLVHPGNVHFSRRNVPYEIFSVMSRHFNLDSITTWSDSSLAECLDAAPLEQWTMYDIEMARHGHGLQFPTADMGWIEVASYLKCS